MNWIVIVYLIGFIPHYFLFRKWFRDAHGWTVGSRWLAIGTSFFSWVGCLASLISIIADSDYGDKEANW